MAKELSLQQLRETDTANMDRARKEVKVLLDKGVKPESIANAAKDAKDKKGNVAKVTRSLGVALEEVLIDDAKKRSSANAEEQNPWLGDEGQDTSYEQPKDRVSVTRPESTVNEAPEDPQEVDGLEITPGEIGVENNPDLSTDWLNGLTVTEEEEITREDLDLPEPLTEQKKKQTAVTAESKKQELNSTKESKAKEDSTAVTAVKKQLEQDRLTTLKNLGKDPSTLVDNPELLDLLRPHEISYIDSQAKQQELRVENARLAKMMDTYRSSGEVAQDAGLSLTKGGVVTVGGFYGLANVLSQGLNATVGTAGRAVGSLLDDGSLFDENGNIESDLVQWGGIDSALGLSEDFTQMRESLTDAQSDGLNNRRDKSNYHLATKRKQRIAELKEQGYDPDSFVSMLGVEADAFGETLGSLWTNPALLADTVIESLPQFLSGGVVKKSADGFLGALKKLRGKDTKVDETALKGMSDTTAGLINTVATEAGNVANEAASSILSMSDKDLMESPAAQVLLEANPDYTPEEMKRILADRASMAAFAIAGPISGITGKLMGTARLQGSVLDRVTGKTGNALRRGGSITGQATRESGEELIQGVSGGVAENVGVGEALGDEDYNPIENTGQEAATGMAAGATVGGALGTLEKANEPLDAGIASVKEQKDIQNGKAKEVADKANEEGNPERALQVLLSPSALKSETLTDEKSRKEHAKNIQKQLDSLFEQQDAAQSEQIEKLENNDIAGADAAKEKADNLFAIYEKYKDKADLAVKALNKDNDSYKAEVEAAKLLDSEDPEVLKDLSEEQINNAFKYFGSDPESVNSSSITKLESLTDRLTPGQREQVANYKKVEKAREQVAESYGRKSFEEVASEVSQGENSKFLGLDNHEKNIGLAIRNNSQEDASTGLDRLGKFATQRTEKAKLARKIYDAKQQGKNVPKLEQEYAERYSADYSDTENRAFINKKSTKLVNQLEAEAELANATYDRAKGAVDLAFNSDSTSTETTTSEQAIEQTPGEINTVDDFKAELKKARDSGVITSNVSRSLSVSASKGNLDKAVKRFREYQAETTQNNNKASSPLDSKINEAQANGTVTEVGANRLRELVQAGQANKAEQILNQREKSAESVDEPVRATTKAVQGKGSTLDRLTPGKRKVTDYARGKLVTSLGMRGLAAENKSTFNKAIVRSITGLATRLENDKDPTTFKDVKKHISQMQKGLLDAAKGTVSESNNTAGYLQGVQIGQENNVTYSLQNALIRQGRKFIKMFKGRPGPKNRISSEQQPIDSYLETEEYSQLTDEQKEAYQTLIDIRDELKTQIPTAFPEMNKKGDLKQEPITWLLTRTAKQVGEEESTETGFSDAVIDAFAVMVFETVGTMLGNGSNYTRDIEGIVGRSESLSGLSKAQYDNFRSIGKPKAMLEDTLKNRAMDLLQLSTKTKSEEQPVLDSEGNPTGETTVDYYGAYEQERLGVAVADFILGLMAQMDFIDVAGYPSIAIDTAKKNSNGSQLAELISEDIEARRNKEKRENLWSNTNFVSPKTAYNENLKENTLTTRVLGVQEEYRAAGSSLISSIFGSGLESREPSTTPIKLSQTKYKRTRQNIPEEVQAIAQKVADEPMGVRKSTSVLFSKLFDLAGNKLVDETFLGVEDPEQVNQEFRENVKSKNSNTLRILADNIAWARRIGDKAYYMAHELWSVGRMGMVGTVGNIQADKNARSIFGYQKQVSSIDLNSEAAEPKVNVFKMAVGQHLGVDIDKQSLEESIAEFHVILDNPAVQEALDVLDIQQEASEELTQDDVQVLADALNSDVIDETGLEPLVGLQALAEYRRAAATSKKLTTDITIEVDGINNGMAISMLQFGTDSLEKTKEYLKATGIYTDGDKSDFSDWISIPGNHDIYQRFSKSWGNAVNEHLKNKKDDQLQSAANSLSNLIGSLVEPNGSVTKLGRKLSKPIVMTSNYLAGIDSQIRAFSNEVYEKVLNDLASGKSNADEFASFMQSIESPLTANQVRTIKEDNPAELKLTKKQKQKIYETIDSIYRAPLEEALEEEYGSNIENMKVLVDVLTAAFHSWKVMYDKATEAKHTELGTDPRLPLPKEIEQEVYDSVKEYAPILPTFFSTNEDGQDTGLEALDSIRKRSTNNKTKVITNFGKEIKGITRAKATKSGWTMVPVKSTVSQPTIREIISAGVGPAAMSIQSIDGATMLNFLKENRAVNVHDAIIVSIDDAIGLTQKMNQSLREVTENYSLVDEAEKIKIRTSRMLNSKGIDVSAEEVNRSIQKELAANAAAKGFIAPKFNKKKNGVEAKLKDAGVKISEMRSQRNDLLSSISVYGQYHMPGGKLEVDNNTDSTGFDDSIDNFVEATRNEDAHFGSDAGGFSDFKPVEDTEVSSTNSMALFGKLSALDGKQLPENHYEHLSKLMNTLVNKALNPVRVRIQKMAPSALGMYSAVENTVDLKISKPNLNLSHKTNAEVYVHELLHAVLHEGLANNTRARKEVAKVFKAVKQAGMRVSKTNPERLLLSGMSNPTDADLREAKKIWDYTIDSRDENYLDEFLNYGLSNQYFLRALENDLVSEELAKTRRTFTVAADDSKSAPVRAITKAIDVLFNVFSDIVNYFSDRYFGTRNMRADQRLYALAKHIADVENNHRDKYWKGLERLDSVQNNAGSAVIDYIIAPLAKFVASSNIPVISQGANIGRTFITNSTMKYNAVSTGIRDMYDRFDASKDNLILSVLSEMTGLNDSNSFLYKLLRKSNNMIDQGRKKVATTVQQLLLNKTFTYRLNRQERESITRAVLKTDLSSLLFNDADLRNMTPQERDEFVSQRSNKKEFADSIKRIKDLISSDTARQNEVDKITNEIKKQFGKNADYYIAQGKNLGLKSAGKASKIHGAMHNAYSIANLHSRRKMTPTGDLKQAEKLIDELAAIVALQNTDSESLSTVNNILENEIANGASMDRNGLVMTMQMHNHFKHDALNKLFGGNPTQMQKGYIKEITNPNRDIAYAVNEEQAKELVRLGYKEVVDNPLPKDKLDPNQVQPRLFVNPVGGINTYNKTILSFTGMQARGSSLYEGWSRTTDNAATAGRFSNQDIQRLSRIIDNRASKGQFNDNGQEVNLEPVLDENGNTVDFRYVMTDETKRDLLELNEDFSEVMGGMFGNIVDKVNTRTINNKAIDYLWQQYNEVGQDNVGNFIEIGPQSNDPDGRDAWFRLPDESKEHVRRVWRKERMYVRKEDFRLLVGFRKATIRNLGEQDLFQKANSKYMRDIGKWISKQVNRPGFRVTENVVVEIVKTAKDTIVVKSGAVLLANTISNMLVLRMEGIPINKMIRYQAEGWKYVTQYKELDNERNEINLLLSSDLRMTARERARKEARVAQINTELDKNPAKDLIDEGIFQTIVEDIEVDDDRYTYKSKLEEWAMPVTEKIPQGVKEIGNIMFMTHDTKLYRAMLDATQLSDFVARYALHKHQLEQKNDDGSAKYTYQQSVDRIINTFVDYDAPSHKAIQYLNDMGVLMFTKFYLRIQKVIMRQLKENPGNVLSFLMMQELFNYNAPDIFDTFIGDLDNLGNRLYSPFDALLEVLQMHLLNVRT